MSALDAVTDATFSKEVLESPLPVIVDFWAPWCGPCRTLTPILEQIAEENTGKVRVVAVNVDENPETATKYGIISIPSVLGLRDGEEVHRVSGAKPKPVLETEFADLLG